MEVTFAWFSDDIASSRLRAKLPQKALWKLGIKPGKDVLVYGKDWVTDEELSLFKRRIYDVCDDHFKTESKRDYYLKHCKEADLLTCNSEVMKDVILRETGRTATVIPEPYESREMAAHIAPRLYWFGHQSNLKDFERIKPQLKYPTLALSNPYWTRETHEKAMKVASIVVIPTGKSLAKSENRMVESIRHGKYVCAEHLPAYEPFNDFFPLGDIPEHIERALSNPEQAVKKIKEAQSFIRDKYHPDTIGKKWLEVIECL